MLKSMTGYGRTEKIINGKVITIEIKSVNHRYLEISSRIPKGYGFIEDKVKQYIKNRISRGKIDLYVGIQSIDDETTTMSINHFMARNYVSVLNELKKTYNLSGDVSVSDIIKCPDIFIINQDKVDEEEFLYYVIEVLDIAFNSFINMRIREGDSLREDIVSRANLILDLVHDIEVIFPDTIKSYEERLRKKLEELLCTRDLDDNRILMETAIFADKIDTSEEIVRLKSHIDQFLDMTKSDDPVGRKLDFIVQEMNREANTIASKCLNSDISHIIVNIKSEIEKIREQVQNIE